MGRAGLWLIGAGLEVVEVEAGEVDPFGARLALLRRLLRAGYAGAGGKVGGGIGLGGGGGAGLVGGGEVGLRGGDGLAISLLGVG